VQLKLYILLGAIILAFSSGYLLNQKLFQAKLDAQMVSAQAQALETSRFLAAAEQKRLQLTQQLEDQANEAPVTSPACLPVDRVQRLNLR
jgi:hypothetical protein